MLIGALKGYCLGNHLVGLITPLSPKRNPLILAPVIFSLLIVNNKRVVIRVIRFVFPSHVIVFLEHLFEKTTC